MTRERVRELHSLAIIIARRLWPEEPDEAESAAGIAVVQVLRDGPGEVAWAAAVSHVTWLRVVDAQRALYGRRMQRKGRTVDLDALDVSGHATGARRRLAGPMASKHDGHDGTFQLTTDPPEDLERVEDRVTAEQRVEALRRQVAGDDRLSEMVELRAAGWSLAAIGERWGVTESRACQVLARVRRFAA